MDQLLESRSPSANFQVRIISSRSMSARSPVKGAKGAAFTGDLADIDRLEIIRTWKFAEGDRLSSN